MAVHRFISTVRKQRTENESPVQEMVAFMDLPEELWMSVLLFLDARSLVALQETCHFFRRLARDPTHDRTFAAFRRVLDYQRVRRRVMQLHYGADFTPKPRIWHEKDVRADIPLAVAAVAGHRLSWKKPHK